MLAMWQVTPVTSRGRSGVVSQLCAGPLGPWLSLMFKNDEQQ